MVSVKVKQDECIGCGSCVAVCPEVFEIGDNGKSQVKDPEGAGVDKIKEAEQICPVDAIIVKE